MRDRWDEATDLAPILQAGQARAYPGAVVARHKEQAIRFHDYLCALLFPVERGRRGKGVLSGERDIFTLVADF